MVYDPDALDYFTRAESLGGSFNLSGINATYTESYVKGAINTFVLGCKTDGIWSKISEAYLLAGVTFGGLMAKLKHAGTPTLTNVNFVAGDYVSAGAGGGLLGNGVNKRLGCNFSISSVIDLSLSAYAVAMPTANSNFIGASDATNSARSFIDYNTTAPSVRGFAGAAGAVASSLVVATGHFLMTRRSTTNLEMFRNGVSSQQTPTTITPTLPTGDLTMFANSTGGTFSSFSSARIAFGHVGSSLTAGEASLFYARVQALMVALGANV